MIENWLLNTIKYIVNYDGYPTSLFDGNPGLENWYDHQVEIVKATEAKIREIALAKLTDEEKRILKLS